MSNAKSDYVEDGILNHLLRNTAFTSPAAVYVALYTVMPTDGGGGTEVSGGDYARQSVTFAAPVSGQVANSGAVTFPVATASWGEVLGMGIFDAATGGHLLYYGLLAVPKTVGIGDQIAFANGALSVSEQ